MANDDPTDKEIRESLTQPGGPNCPNCCAPFGLEFGALTDAELGMVGPALHDGRAHFAVDVDGAHACPTCGAKLAARTFDTELQRILQYGFELTSVEDMEDWARRTRDAGRLTLS